MPSQKLRPVQKSVPGLLIVSSTSIAHGMFIRDKSQTYLVSLVFARYSIWLLIFRSLQSNNYHFGQTLRSLLYHFSKNPLRSVLYHGHRLIAEESILMEQPCVCLAQFFVECSWITLFSLADI